MHRRGKAAWFLSAVTALSVLASKGALADTKDLTATPSNAQKEETTVITTVTTALDKMLSNAKAADTDYDKIRDMPLYVIGEDEERIMTVEEMTEPIGAINVFVFGDMKGCGNTKGVMSQLSRQMEGMNVEIYYLDIKGNSGEDIKASAAQLLTGKAPFFLCEDRDNQYAVYARKLIGNGTTMPFVFVEGKEQETLYLSDYSYSGSYADYVNELREGILEAYPDEMPDLKPDTNIVYMYPETRRLFPIADGERYNYSSDAPEVADVQGNVIVAKSPGPATITVRMGDKTSQVGVLVIDMKDDYTYEWNVLRLMNKERINAGLLPITTLDSFQKAADIRAFELGSLFQHLRPDGTDIETVTTELGIRSPWNSGENIAAGQWSPLAVMDSWMNSSGHKANILSAYHTHVGVGYQNVVTGGYGTCWVQYFGRCSGKYSDISLVTREEGPAEIFQGESLDYLGYELKMVCSACGEARMPVIDEICEFDREKVGEQKVKVTYGDWSGTFDLTIKERKLVESIAVTPDNLTLTAGSQATLEAAVSPVDAYDSSVTWYSTDPDIVSVRKDGTINAKSVGTAEIYCVAADESEIESSRCKVTVTIFVQNISVSPTSVVMRPGEEKTMKAEAYPNTAVDKSLEWHSTNPSVAKVSSQGVVTAAAEGTAEIYCVAKDGGGAASMRCQITVKVPRLVQTIALSVSDFSIKPGDKRTISHTIVPENAENKSVTWYSTNTNVASVDAKGNVTGIAAGTAEIYCVSQDEGKIESAHCKVTVTANSSSGSGSGGGGSSSGSGSGGNSSGSGSGGSSSGSGSGGSSSGSGSGGSSSGSGSGGSSSGSGNGGSSSGSGSGGSSSGSGSGGSSSGSGSGGSSSGSSSGGSSSGSGGGSGSGSRGKSGSGSGGPSGAGTSLPSYVIRGSWTQRQDGTWTFADSQGMGYVNVWAAVENPYADQAAGQQGFDWFRFDETGKMLTGWYRDSADGYLYYLNPVSDNTLGKMITGWYVIDGNYYYFNPASDGHRGRMYVNEVTPDGYRVDENGKWVQ